MRGPQFQADQCVVKVGYAASVELVAQAVPWLIGGRTHFAPIEKDVALVGLHLDGQSVFRDLAARRRYSSPVSESRYAKMIAGSLL